MNILSLPPFGKLRVNALGLPNHHGEPVEP